MLDEKGFKRKTYADIVEDLFEQARLHFGDDVNLSERSPLGLFLRVIAWSLGILWMLAENVYYSAFVRSAKGVNLDRVAQYVGIVRRDKAKAIGQVKFTGEAGTLIPAAFIVGTKSGVLFQTKTYLVLDVNGEGTVDVEAVEAGANGNVPIGNITEILNPMAGLNAVTNLDETSEGRDVESDTELRSRYNESVSKIGASTVDAVRATLLSVSGVDSAFVEENDTMNTANGIPAKSIAAYVYGGIDSDIAKAIFETKAGGIQAYGSTIVSVLDLAGNPHQIGFTRVTEIPVYIRVTLQRGNDYPAEGDKQVKTSLIQYVGGQDEDAQEYRGLPVASDVIYNKLVHSVLQVTGIDDVTLEVSMDGITYNELQNIAIDQKQIARTDWQKIEVV